MPDFLPSRIFLGLLVLAGLLALSIATAAQPSPLAFLALVVCAWTITVCLHEFAHALVAYLGGDKSVRHSGYLTFNPLKYAHPLFSLGLPVISVALGGLALPGGAVSINRLALRSRHWEACVSGAGPLINLGLLALIGTGFRLGMAPAGTSVAIIWAALAVLAVLQASVTILNLLPVPGLDGYGILRPYFPHHFRARMAAYDAIGPTVVVFALFALRPVRSALARAGIRLAESFGVDDAYLQAGYVWLHAPLADFWEAIGTPTGTGAVLIIALATAKLLSLRQHWPHWTRRHF